MKLLGSILLVLFALQAVESKPKPKPDPLDVIKLNLSLDS